MSVKKPKRIEWNEDDEQESAAVEDDDETPRITH